MQLTDLAIFLLATAGLSLGVTWSSLFKPFRDLFDVGEQRRRRHYSIVDKGGFFTKTETVKHFFYRLFSCSFCFGFWASFIIYFLMGTTYGYALCMAFAGATVSYAIYSQFYKE
jgi:hypothetical protein